MLEVFQDTLGSRRKNSRFRQFFHPKIEEKHPKIEGRIGFVETIMPSPILTQSLSCYPNILRTTRTLIVPIQVPLKPKPKPTPGKKSNPMNYQ
jgi:hypothetical protein